MSVHRAPAARLTIPPDVTGTWLSVDWAATLDAALRLQPQTRQVLVVGGASSRDEIWMASARTQLAPYQSKVAIHYLSAASTLAQALRTVAGLPDDAIVLVSTFHRDSAGKDFASREAVARIARESRVPVYGVLETLVGAGVVGGHVLSSALDGEKAARLALRVLAGDRAGPPVPGQHRSHLRLVAAAALGPRRASAALRQRAPLPPALALGGVPLARRRGRAHRPGAERADRRPARAAPPPAASGARATAGGRAGAARPRRAGAHPARHHARGAGGRDRPRDQPALDGHRDERRGDAPDREPTARRRTRPPPPWPTSRRMPCGPRRSSSGCGRSAARSAASLARSISSG